MMNTTAPISNPQGQLGSKSRDVMAATPQQSKPLAAGGRKSMRRAAAGGCTGHRAQGCRWLLCSQRRPTGFYRLAVVGDDHDGEKARNTSMGMGQHSISPSPPSTSNSHNLFCGMLPRRKHVRRIDSQRLYLGGDARVLRAQWKWVGPISISLIAIELHRLTSLA